MTTFAGALTCFLAGIVLIATLLPLTRSVRWWVRAWEFPRLHIAIVAVITAILVLVVPVVLKGLIVAALVATIAYQAAHIFPYTRFLTPEVHIVDGVPDASKIKPLSANVLKENARKSDLVHIIEGRCSLAVLSPIFLP